MAHGFRLSIPTKLEMDPESRPESTASELSLRLHLKSHPDSSSILLTTDQLPAGVKFENYSHKWLKEYANYGFDVNRTQKLNSEFGKGWLLDFFHRTKGQQVRQIILNYGSQIAVITCSDSIQNFTDTSLACTQVFKEFSWIIK